MIVSKNASATEDPILDTISAQSMAGLKIVTRGAGPGNAGKLLVADGTVDGVAARLGAIAVAANGGMVVGVLIAKQSEFAALGGTDLVVSVLGSLRASGPTVMQPQFDAYGSQIIPPPARPLTVADLAGTWERNGAGSSTYVDSTTGVYAGVYGTSGAQTKHTGKASFDDRGILVIKWDDRTARFIVRGWYYGKDVVLLRMNGPHGDPITAEMLAPNWGGNLNETFAKKR